MKTIYIAGKYTAENKDAINNNVNIAFSAMDSLVAAGWTPFCPHTMFHMADVLFGWGYDTIMRMCLEWLSKCDAIVLLDGYENSNGAMIEKRCAESLAIPIYYGYSNVPVITAE